MLALTGIGEMQVVTLMLLFFPEYIFAAAPKRGVNNNYDIFVLRDFLFSPGTG